MGKPELQKVMQRRKADAYGNVGPIRPDRVNKTNSSSGSELEKQLARRTQLLDQVSLSVLGDPLPLIIFNVCVIDDPLPSMLLT